MNLRQLLFLCSVLVAFINMKASAVYSMRTAYVNFQSAFVEQPSQPQQPVKVEVGGVFPNGCYHWMGAEVKQLDANNYEVKGLALLHQGMCTMQLVDFHEKVNLGVLPPGHHKVWISSNNGQVLLREIQL